MYPIFRLPQDVIYIVNANDEIQKIKISLGWDQEKLTQTLSVELRMVALLASGVIDSDVFYLSTITRRVCWFHRKLFESGALSFSVKGKDNFFENYLNLKAQFPEFFLNFHDTVIAKHIFNKISTMGLPYRRDGITSTLAVKYGDETSKKQTEDILKTLPKVFMPKNTDKFITYLHENIVENRGNEPLLPYYFFNELKKRGYKDLYIKIKKDIEINLLNLYLPIAATAHSTKLVNYSMLGIGDCELNLEKYNIPLFLECMRLLGIENYLLQMNDEQIIQLKKSIHFQLFIDSYFKIIDEASSISNAITRIKNKINFETLIDGKLFLNILKKYSTNKVKNTFGMNCFDIIKNIIFNLKDVSFIHFKDYILEDFESSIYDKNKNYIDKNTKEEDIMKSPKVFIIHGHDNGLKTEVQLLLTRAGVDNVVLHEVADKGRTIIEKLFDEGDKANYAIALFSPDDSMSSGVIRARQNVILEVGYFLGKLGKDRVRLLIKGDIEIPSDLLGILYEKHDNSGAWRINLLKELQAVNIDVDIANVINAF